MAKKKQAEPLGEAVKNFAANFSIPSLFLIIGMDYAYTYSDLIPNIAAGAGIVTFIMLFWLEFIYLDNRIPREKDNAVYKLVAIAIASLLVSLPQNFISIIFVTVIGYSKLTTTK